MDVEKILNKVDHTNLKVGATWEDIKSLCEEAVKYKTASVCIPPCYVKEAADYLNKRIPVCTVIGFPNGYHTTAAKVFEIRDAIENGASEVDLVINHCWVRDRKYELISEELREARKASKGCVLKVIVETCLLTEEEKIKMCGIVTASGADFIKTSTGFSSYGATPEDVTLLVNHIGAKVKCKASGGIKTLEDAAEYLRLGADRLGTSAAVKDAMKRE